MVPSRLLGKSYARGGPASVRKKRSALRQTELTTVLKRGKASGKKALSTAGPQKITSPAIDSEHSQSEDDRATFVFRKDAHSSDLEDDSTETLQKAPPVQTAHIDEVAEATALAQPNKRRKKSAVLRQSKIELTSGVSRFVSTDPADSEEESFRATQVESKQEKTTRLRGKGKVQGRVKVIDINSDSEAEANTESEGELPTTLRSLGLKAKKLAVADSDDEGLVTPSSRRKRFMPDSPGAEPAGTANKIQLRKQGSEGEDEELKIEVRNLDRKDLNIGKQRQRNVQKSAFKDTLNRLRRKKAGLPSESEEDGSEAESQDAPLSPKDWIVEDDVDRQQMIDNLPEEFQQPRQPLEQFKIAVQWEILDLLMPQGGLAPDRYFKPAIDWLRDRTYGKSQAAVSSIWRRTFVRALRRGPHINAIETGNLGYFCDACGRTNRIATYVVKFEGARYDHMTLEDLYSDASSSEDDLNIDENAASDPEAERERKERTLRAEFNLGSNCYDRTVATHELYHLRKHLREDIHEKLNELDLFSAGKIYERSTLTKSKRIELANQVTEELDVSRFQQRLWSRYKVTMEKHEAYIADPNSGRRKSKYAF